MRSVAPFMPLPAEFDHHKALSDFDWIAAIRMMSTSVRRFCQCDVHVITDVETDLPVPCLKYTTHHRRLMLWYLEVGVAYLTSADFNQDTVMLDSDQLIYGDLSRWFVSGMDLGLLVRELPRKDLHGFPVLNGVQFWPHQAKDKLIGFYRRALAIAESLPEDQIVWGADTIALQQLIQPYAIGKIVERSGLRVRQIESEDVSQRLSNKQIRQVMAGDAITINRDVLDFRNMRKVYMAAIYEHTIGSVLTA